MSDSKTYDLAIIGGGPSALAIIGSFLEKGERAVLPESIVIFESKPKSEMGRGIFAAEGAIDSHLMLNPGPRMPRKERGEQLNEEFKRKVGQLESRGVKVDIRSGAEVTACEKEGNSHLITYHDADGEHQLKSHISVLATGHFKEKSDYDGRKDYVPPYPPKRMMERVPKDGTTVALGTGPTGVDTAIAWAEKVGTFKADPRNPGKFTYSLNKDSQDANLVLASPNGLLPKVMERDTLPGAKGTHAYLNDANIERLRSRGKGYVALNDLIDLTAGDLMKINPDHYMVDRVKSMVSADSPSVSAITKALTPEEPAATTLTRDIDVAHGGSGSDKRKGFFRGMFSGSKAHGSAWQAELSLNPTLSAASQYFSAEDMLRFQSLRPILNTYSAPIPPENAEKLMALFEAQNSRGQPVLQVVKLKSKKPPERDDNGGYIVKTSDGDLHADLLVDGVPGKDIRKHPSRLIQQMLQDGMVQPGFATFTTNAGERDAANRMDRGDRNFAMVDDRIVLLTDGLAVNPTTREVVPANSADLEHQEKSGPLLLAMGNLVPNRLLTSMGMLKSEATQITTQISKKLDAIALEAERTSEHTDRYKERRNERSTRPDFPG